MYSGTLLLTFLVKVCRLALGVLRDEWWTDLLSTKTQHWKPFMETVYCSVTAHPSSKGVSFMNSRSLQQLFRRQGSISLALFLLLFFFLLFFLDLVFLSCA